MSAALSHPHNDFLERLDADASAELSLVPVHLQPRQVLHEAGMPVLHAYFPTSAVISLVSATQSGGAVEVALVGRESVVGLEEVLGQADSPMTSVVQVSGLAFRAPIHALKAVRRRHASVRTLLDRYTQVHLIQVAQIAACNRLHAVEARLARWLLSLSDRVDGEPITISQEVIAQMLGVQRPTVSIAMQRIHDGHAIAFRGRAIVVSDRIALEGAACECYRVVRREFDRLRSTVDDEPASVSQPGDPLLAGGRQSAATIEAMRQIAGRLLVAGLREQEARESAEAANRAKDQFLAMVSHDLRTPLNAILGWCAMLMGPMPGSVERGLHVIRQNATAQLKLVEDLLDAVRLGSSTLVIQPTEVQLGEVVQEAVDATQPMADDKQVTLRVAIADEVAPILADAARLRQVFVNVVGNAVKFTDVGGSVDVCLTSADASARVTVRDTGRGIAPDALSHVFERFRQEHGPADAVNGLGLGLTIAQALIELHGGRIQIASPGEGLGATCTIDLPLTAKTQHR
jgi:signal transduction histidine kinase